MINDFMHISVIFLSISSIKKVIKMNNKKYFWCFHCAVFANKEKNPKNLNDVAKIYNKVIQPKLKIKMKNSQCRFCSTE